VSVVADTIDRLRGYGVELTPIPPDRVCWHASGPLSDEARDLLEALKARKSEVLSILATAASPDPRPWEQTWERARLIAASTWADEEAGLCGTSWAKCWSYSRHQRPDLVEALDNALDAIDAGWKACDVGQHIAACDLLRCAVRAIVEAAPASGQ
jgi:hypothetical protein